MTCEGIANYYYYFDYGTVTFWVETEQSFGIVSHDKLVVKANRLDSF